MTVYSQRITIEIRYDDQVYDHPHAWNWDMVLEMPDSTFDILEIEEPAVITNPAPDTFLSRGH